MKKTKPTNAYTGSILFDGNMTVTLADGEKKTLRTDHLGTALKQVNPHKEVLILMRGNADYNEIDTGFVFFRKKMQNLFCIKPTTDSETYAIKSLSNVIAWGYADGGLNNDRFYSCQCTPEQEAELERQRKAQGIAVPESVSNTYDGVEIGFKHKDGRIGVQFKVNKKQLNDYLTAAEKWLKPTLGNFQKFTKHNPDICEIHYFTKPTVWEEE